jgi:hypothetical protein
MMRILFAVDDHMIELARSILARLRTVRGIDKFSVIRDLYLTLAGLGAFWTWFGYGISIWISVMGIGIASVNLALATRAGKLVGSADTARGFENAMRMAAAHYSDYRISRTVNLLADVNLIALLVWTLIVVGGSDADFDPTGAIALALMAAYSILGSVVAYFEAAPPPAPGSRTEERVHAATEGA